MGNCCSSPTQPPEEGVPPPPAQIDPRFGPTPLQASELRLCLAMLGHGRLGTVALERLGVRADGDVLRSVGAHVSGRWPAAELEAVELTAAVAAAAADPVFANASRRKEVRRWLSKASWSRRLRGLEGCEGPVVNPALLFRASRDGWDANAFHRHCDGQGSTLTVIREREHGYVFGGYADAPWHSGSSSIRSDGGAFLFALRCAAGLGPTRMGLTGARNRWAMGGYRNFGCGPYFGSDGDLRLGATLGRDAGDGSRTHVGRFGVYRCPVGQDGATLLTGAGKFRASEVEVYRVETAAARRARLAVEVAKAAEMARLAAEAAADPVFANATTSLEILGWLAEAQADHKTPQCELLFRASRDGWDANAFHKHCDGQGSTLTVIREREHGYVFGGYADAPWHSGSDGPSPGRIESGGGAFLFALQCAAGLGPTQMGLMGSATLALRGYADCGPCFGNGNDIRLGLTLGRDAGDGSRTHVGRFGVYRCPVGQDCATRDPGQDGATLLTGAEEFRAAEVEVYHVVAR
jgi:hypothetical protein